MVLSDQVLGEFIGNRCWVAQGYCGLKINVIAAFLRISLQRIKSQKEKMFHAREISGRRPVQSRSIRDRPESGHNFSRVLSIRNF